MSRSLSILIVEDSDDDTALLIAQLRRDGFEPVYERVETAQSMDEALDKKNGK